MPHSGDRAKRPQPHTEGRRDLRCVWMTAGVLSYWLCPRDYACDECPLNCLLQGKSQELEAKGVLRTGEDVMQDAETPRFEHLRVPLRRRRGLHYHPTHVWGRELAPGRIQLGLDDMAGRLTRGAEGWSLPTVGTRIAAGDDIGRNQVLGVTFAVASPILGRVVARNDALRAHPTLAVWSPYDAGWLVELDSSARLSPLEGFIHDEADAASWFAEELDWLASLRAPNPWPGESGVGPTLADGGLPLGTLVEVLGEDGCRAALRGLFSSSAGS